MSWTITIDIPITRRARRHQLRNEHGEVKGTHTLISDALAQAVALDVRRLHIISPNGEYLIDIDTPPW